MSFPSHPQNRGFTLIELLIVISIIALLIGILLPALDRARVAARSSTSLSNLRQQGIAVAAYAAARKNELPKHSSPTTPLAAHEGRSFHGSHSWGGFTNRPRYPDYLFDLMPSTEVWLSPTLSDGELERMKKKFAHDQTKFFGGYGYNFQYCGNARAGTTQYDVGGGTVTTGDSLPYHAKLDKDIRAHSSTIVIGDCTGSRQGNIANQPGVSAAIAEGVYSLDPPLPAVSLGSRGNKNTGSSFGAYYWANSSYAPSQSIDGECNESWAKLGTDQWRARSFLAERNIGKTANVLFLDGHAEAGRASKWDDFDGDGVFDNGYYNGYGKVTSLSISGSNFQTLR